MSITIAFEGGLFCPVVNCDHCGRQISNAEDAMYEWERDGAPVLFMHRECSRAFNASREAPTYWAPLDELFVRLAHNTGQSPRQLMAVARKMERVPQ